MMFIYLALGLVLGWTLRSLYAASRKYAKRRKATHRKHELQRKWNTWYQIERVLFQEEGLVP